jgi:hypothetical protein
MFWCSSAKRENQASARVPTRHAGVRAPLPDEYRGAIFLGRARTGREACPTLAELIDELLDFERVAVGFGELVVDG